MEHGDLDLEQAKRFASSCFTLSRLSPKTRSLFNFLLEFVGEQIRDESCGARVSSWKLVRFLILHVLKELENIERSKSSTSARRPPFGERLRGGKPRKRQRKIAGCNRPDEVVKFQNTSSFMDQKKAIVDELLRWYARRGPAYKRLEELLQPCQKELDEEGRSESPDAEDEPKSTKSNAKAKSNKRSKDAVDEELASSSGKASSAVDREEAKRLKKEEQDRKRAEAEEKKAAKLRLQEVERLKKLLAVSVIVKAGFDSVSKAFRAISDGNLSCLKE